MLRQREPDDGGKVQAKGRLTEGRFRQREQTDRGKVQTKGADGPREGSGKGSRLTEGVRKTRLTEGRQREQTDRGKVQAKGAD